MSIHVVMESGVKSRVRVGFGCHSLGFGSGTGVTSSGSGIFCRVSGFFRFQKMNKICLKFVLSNGILFFKDILYKKNALI